MYANVLSLMEIKKTKQGIQDNIPNWKYPNYKVTNKQNEKVANIKVKLMKVWIWKQFWS